MTQTRPTGGSKFGRRQGVKIQPPLTGIPWGLIAATQIGATG